MVSGLKKKEENCFYFPNHCVMCISTPSKLWLTLLKVTFVHRNRETTAWVSSTVDFCLNSQIESEKPLLYWFKNSKYAVAIPPSPCILFRYHYLISFLCTFMHSARRGF